MTQTPDSDDVGTRARLLPEEQTVGSDAPQLQAELILEESLARTEDPDGTQRASTQTLAGEATGPERPAPPE